MVAVPPNKLLRDSNFEAGRDYTTDCEAGKSLKSFFATLDNIGLPI